MSQNEVGYSAVYQKIEKLLRDWLAETGGLRVDTYYNAIHLAGEVEHWLTVDGRRESVRLPSKINFAMDDLRPAQADPHRGAWLWSHLWMEAVDGVLHQESDWMREPVINGEPVSEQGAAVELRIHPRDPEYIPEWMATKAAAFQKKEEARARRRDRDRARRERKKADAAQAAQEAETNTSSTASEAAGKASS